MKKVIIIKNGIGLQHILTHAIASAITDPMNTSGMIETIEDIYQDLDTSTLQSIYTVMRNCLSSTDGYGREHWQNWFDLAARVRAELDAREAGKAEPKDTDTLVKIVMKLGEEVDA